MLHPHHHMHHTHNGPIAICLHFEWGWNIVPCIPFPFFLSLKLFHVHEQHEAVSFTEVLGEAPVPAPMIVHIRAPDVVATPIVWTSEDTVLFVSKQTSEVKHKDTFETIQLHLILLLHLASCSKQTKQRTYLSQCNKREMDPWAGNFFPPIHKRFSHRESQYMTISKNYRNGETHNHI